jgi:hypothetical protein
VVDLAEEVGDIKLDHKRVALNEPDTKSFHRLGG